MGAFYNALQKSTYLVDIEKIMMPIWRLEAQNS